MDKKKKLLHLLAKVVSTDEAEKGIVEGVVASTSVIDRHGDTIQQDGWDLKNFKNNPVILWAHNADGEGLPIGKSLKTWIDGKGKDAKLRFTCQFDMQDNFAAEVCRKVREGFINCVSVGFLPEEWEQLDEDDFWSGYNFTKQELLEISWVPVPANPEAGKEIMTLGFEPVEEKDLYAPSMRFKKLAEKKEEKSEEQPAEEEEPKEEATEEVVAEETLEKEPAEEDKKLSSEETKENETNETVKRVCRLSVTEDHKAFVLTFDNGETLAFDLVDEALKMFEEKMSKAGRTLSAKNEALLRDAHTKIATVLATLPDPDNDDDDKAIHPSLLKRIQSELKVQDKSIEMTLRRINSALSLKGGEK